MQTVIRKIVDLNLTAIEKPVAEAFAPKKPASDANKLKTEQSDVQGYFKELDVATIMTMIESSNDLADKMKPSDELGKKFALSLHQATQLKLRKAFAHLTTEALKKQASLNTLPGTITKKKLAVRQKMLAALYGQAARPAQSVSDMAADTPYTAVLAPTTFQREGTDRDEGGGNNFCGEGKGGDNNAIHTSDQVQKATEVWTTIAKQCDALNGGKPPLLTPAALTAEVTAIFTHPGRKYIALTVAPTNSALVEKRRHFLGLHTIYNNGPSCKAPANTATTAGKVVCIDYSAQMRDVKGIPWVRVSQTRHWRLRSNASRLRSIQGHSRRYRSNQNHHGWAFADRAFCWH
ncbi:Trypanosomal VSG domain containing protein, putative [Trypanosoma equiperdum]|uniref:Trypanosomal VSG domain containing protein, putative n=1 Tax=Trypanosoma equiperdum TaxID=5694 RepID=A0A1G4IDY0_TRYEQ|nr:Trypanosomal VSG domain containing protein, putative [Trypanosoma equiperdum]